MSHVCHGDGRDPITWDIITASQGLRWWAAGVRSPRQVPNLGSPMWDTGALAGVLQLSQMPTGAWSPSKGAIVCIHKGVSLGGPGCWRAF